MIFRLTTKKRDINDGIGNRSMVRKRKLGYLKKSTGGYEKDNDDKMKGILEIDEIGIGEYSTAKERRTICSC